MSSVPRNVLLALFVSSLLSGCASNLDPPMIFVQTHTLGATATTTGGQATPELSLGYRDVDVAVVPVTSGGVPIRSVTPGGSGQFQDALSVLGQFDAGVSVSPGITLGKFFATGTAASKLAEGYRCQLGAKGRTDAGSCTVAQ